jgi:hypothetical protein
MNAPLSAEQAASHSGSSHSRWQITLIDELRHLKVNGTIQATDQKNKSDPTPFRIQGTGTINDQSFKLNLHGGRLMDLNPEHPYPFDMEIIAGDLRVESKGRILKPFDLTNEADRYAASRGIDAGSGSH